MPPLSSRLLGVARCTLLDGSLRAEAARGRCLNGARRQSTKTTKGRVDIKQKKNISSTWLGGIRFNATWRRAAIATTPKMSDSKPLLGALFGASALAYLGSSFVTKDDSADTKFGSESSVDIVDTEGESAKMLFRQEACDIKLIPIIRFWKDTPCRSHQAYSRCRQ